MNRREAVKRGLGRIRIDDNSLHFAGLNKGDVTLVKLGAQPKQNELCAAFTPWGELVVRRYYRKENGDVRLSTGQKGEVFQVFAPGAVVIFGPVVGIEKGGAR
jgi:SOS-response transcriptional repressor LexA